MLALTPLAMDTESGVANIRALKRRSCHQICFVSLIAYSGYAWRNAIRGLRRRACDGGAERLRGGTLKWR